MNPQGETVIDLTQKLGELITLGINTIYIDQNQLLWLGTNAGIIKIEFRAKKFQTYAKDYDPILAIRGMTQISENKILFSTKRQSYFLDIPTAAIQPLEHIVPGYTVYQATDSTLWLASYGYELDQLKIDGSGQENYLFDGENTKDNSVKTYCVFQDSTARLWLGTNHGLAYFDTISKTIIPWKQYGDYPDFAEAEVFQQISTPDGNWLATSKGLFNWNVPDEFISSYNSTQATPYHIPADAIGFIHADAQLPNILWLGTRNKGLIRLDISTGVFQHWTQENGLRDNTIYAIYEDDFGALWLSSNNGIMRFDKRTGLIKSYLVNDGIAHQEFNTSSHLKLADGRLLFGGINGITLFDPADFQQDTHYLYEPPLVLTLFSRFDRNTHQDINETEIATSSQQLSMRPTDLYIRFDFAILDFANSSEHLYAYQIDGLSKVWQILDEPSLQLYSLPPGNYTIRIKAQSLTSGKPEQYLNFQLRVWGPFYKRLWFIVLVVSIIGLLIGLGFRVRIQQAKQAQQQLELEVKKRTEQILADKHTIEAQAKRLQELDDMKSRFYANISHELRTPLTLILGPVQALLENARTDVSERVRDALNMVKRNSKRLLTQVEEILDLSKLEANRIQLEETPIALTSFVRRTISTFDYEAQQNEIDLQLHTAPDASLHVMLDTNKAEKIINNLLYNALKFTPKKGRIGVDIQVLEEYIEITIEDNGRGISANDLPHIFDRYFQASNEATSTKIGTGIGLAFASELALLMGGELTASSTLGEGSTFSFRFPKKETEGQPLVEVELEASIAQANVAQSLAAKHIDDAPVVAEYRILMVEDNADLQLFTKQLLEEDGYEVACAENGKIALAMLKEQPAHLIVSDVMMPVMDGFSFLQHLKADIKLRQIPVIMLTARAALQDKLHALRIGVDDYLIKPFEPQELLLRVSNLLHNYQEKSAFEIGLTAQGVLPPAASVANNLSWQERFEALTLAHLNDHRMSVPFLAEQLGMSERQLYREVKRFTGLTPNHYIRTVRLQQARRLLEARHLSSVTEVCQAVGFQKTSYLSRIYLEQFGRLPSSYFAR